jgi:hypothetical protein
MAVAAFRAKQLMKKLCVFYILLNALENGVCNEK